MKSIVFMLLALMPVNLLNAQNQTNRNEVAMDLPPFVFRGFGVQQPTFMLAYRRFFNQNALRMHVGGYYFQMSSDRENIYYDQMNSVEYNGVIRLGWEHYKSLSDKWNMYFGLDLLYVSRLSKEDYFENNTKSHEVERKVDEYGIAPIIGVEFSLSERISLRTETQLNITQGELTNVEKYHATGVEITQKTKYAGARIGAPTSLYLAIKF